MAAIELCDKSNSHRVSAAKFVNDMTGILVNELCDKSNLFGKMIAMKKLCESHQLANEINLLTIPFLGSRTIHRANFLNCYAIVRPRVAQIAV